MNRRITRAVGIALAALGVCATATVALAQTKKQGQPYGYGPYERYERRYYPEEQRRGPITPIPRPRTFDDLAGPSPSPPPQPRMIPRVGQ